MSSGEPTRQLIRPCTLVHAILMLLTCVTWAVGRSGLDGLGLALLVLLLALFKGQLIGDWFMGLSGVRGPWRWVVAIWLLVPGSLIALAFVLSHGS